MIGNFSTPWWWSLEVVRATVRNVQHVCISVGGSLLILNGRYFTDPGSFTTLFQVSRTFCQEWTSVRRESFSVKHFLR